MSTPRPCANCGKPAAEHWVRPGVGSMYCEQAPSEDRYDRGTPASTCRSVHDEDRSTIYIFGGEPNERGTHPRRAGIVAEDGGVCVYFVTRGHESVVLDVEDGQMPAMLRRIADFIDGASS